MNNTLKLLNALLLVADITLDQAGNDFTGAVAFAGAGGLHDVTVNDLSASIILCIVTNFSRS